MRLCKHPCPGCGKTDYWGNKGTLCSDCRDALAVGNQVLKARKTNKDAPVGAFSIPWAYYAFPYFRHGESHHAKYTVSLGDEDYEGHAKDVFERVFYRLIELVSEPSQDHDAPPLVRQECAQSDRWPHLNPTYYEQDLALLPGRSNRRPAVRMAIAPSEPP